MATVLITGFGPFPGAPDNPSAQIVARVARMRRPAFDRHRLISHVFATSYDEVDRELPVLLAKHRPDVIVMFGLAARTAHIRVETRARNSISSLHPDAARQSPAARAIAQRKPSSKAGLAPFVRLVSAARATGADARLSRNAGSYVCNFLYWRALDTAQRPKGPKLAVFVHVPKLRGPRRAQTPRPTLNQLARAAEAIIAASLSATSRR